MGTIVLFAALLSGPRVNGIYRSGHSYLRFYADGTVIETASTGKPAEVLRWLTPALPMVSKGTWRVERGRLSLRLIIPEEPGVMSSIALDYEGPIRDGVLDLRWQNRHEKPSLDRRGRSRFRFFSGRE